MKVAIFLFLVLPLSATALSAPTLESRYLAKLGNARSAAQVGNLEAAYQKLKILRLACHIQLSQRTLPYSCFEAAHSEETFDLYDRAQTARLNAKLDQHCLAVVRSGKFPKVLPSEQLAALSKTCRARLEQAWKIQAYRNEAPIEAWSEF